MNTSKSLTSIYEACIDRIVAAAIRGDIEAVNKYAADGKQAIVEAVEGLLPEEDTVSYRFGKKISRDDDYAKGSRYGFNMCRDIVLQAIKEWQ